MARTPSRRNVQVEVLGEAIATELTIYASRVEEGIKAAGEKAVKDLVKKTRATAPVGARGSFRKNITSTTKHKTRRNTTYVWHVKPPDHRLTHLLVKGHATRDGGRTRSNSFLTDALDEVLPEYEKEVEEAIKNG